MIKKIGSRYCLYTKDGSRKLGCHGTRAEAVAQERAVEAAKHDRYAELRAAFDPDQARDEGGQWTSGGGGGGGSAAGSSSESAGAEIDFDKVELSDVEISAMSAVTSKHDAYIEHLSSEDVAHHPEFAQMRDALEDYSGDGYQQMNSRLRQNPSLINDFEGEPGFDGDEEGSRSLTADEKIVRMSEVIDDAPKLKTPVTVYRGVSHEFVVNEGDNVVLNGFQSASFEPGVATDFIGGKDSLGRATVLKIRAKRGLALSGHSRGGEQEFILNHGEKFRVKKIQRARRTQGAATVSLRVVELEML